MRQLRLVRPLLRRPLTIAPPPPPPSRIDRLPPSLRRYAAHFRTAPGTHLSAFLILHELTAIVPMAGLFYAFHVTQRTPASLLPEDWVQQGVKKWGGYLERKGWGSSAQVVLEVASAWAVVKALLPVRIAGCLWATPWAARVGMGIAVAVRRVVGRTGAKL